MKSVVLLGVIILSSLCAGAGAGGAAENSASPAQVAGASDGTVAPRAPGIEVEGENALVIPSGSQPRALDGTKFFPGEVGSGEVTQFFTIRNTGTTALELEDPAITFIGSPNISISSQPGVATVPAGGTISFSMTFNRSVFGLHVGTVQIPSNAGYYYFGLEGRAFHASSPVEFTFNGNISIPDDNGAGTDIPFTVAGLSGQICTLQVEANGTDCAVAAQTGIQHTWISDLQIKLTSPSGKIVQLFDRRGGSGDNMCHTVFDDTATSGISEVTAPFSGTFRPEEPLYEFAGENPTGTWNLNVADTIGLDTGVVHSVSLVFRTETSPAAAKDWELFY